MENNRNNNKFWKGVLVGALVMAFAGLIIVGFSAGIFLIGRTVIDSQVQTEQLENDVSGEGAGLELERIASKMELIPSSTCCDTQQLNSISSIIIPCRPAAFRDYE